MSIIIDGTLGVSAVQDGIISESKLATGAVTDGKLSLTPNSQEVKDALNATGSAPIYACRAWVNFNGAGTVAIYASGNVNSITDNGTGDYTVNFTTDMPDANYAIHVTEEKRTTDGFPHSIGKHGNFNLTNAGVRILATYSSNTAWDREMVHVAIFR